MQHITWLYRATTVVLALFLLFMAIGDLTRHPTVAADLEQLGFPLHLATLLGTAKLLALATLVAPGLPTLRSGLSQV